MATQLLHFLSAQAMPYRFSRAAEIDNLRVLVIGGLVKAKFYGASGHPHDPAVLAIVQSITVLGTQSLRYFPENNGQRGKS